MPFERVQTLLEQEYQGKPFADTFKRPYQLYTRYGFKEFYRGLTPILLRNGISSPLYFGIKKLVQDKKIPILDSIQNKYFSFSGAAIGGIVSYFTFPLNLAKIHLQRKEHVDKKSWDVFKEIYKKKGCPKCNSCKGCSYAWYKMYRGAGLNSIRAYFYWGITDAVYEYVKKMESD